MNPELVRLLVQWCWDFLSSFWLKNLCLLLLCAVKLPSQKVARIAVIRSLISGGFYVKVDKKVINVSPFSWSLCCYPVVVSLFAKMGNRIVEGARYEENVNFGDSHLLSVHYVLVATL